MRWIAFLRCRNHERLHQCTPTLRQLSCKNKNKKETAPFLFFIIVVFVLHFGCSFSYAVSFYFLFLLLLFFACLFLCSSAVLLRTTKTKKAPFFFLFSGLLAFMRDQVVWRRAPFFFFFSCCCSPSVEREVFPLFYNTTTSYVFCDHSLYHCYHYYWYLNLFRSCLL